MTVVGVFSRGIAAIPHLAAFLGVERLVLRPGRRDARGLDAVVGWGRRPSAQRAADYAARHGLPYWALEDGFLRSLDLAAAGAPPLSLVVDDLGIYYDATRPSRLEVMLNDEAGWESEALMAEADRAAALILARGLSKYNTAPEPPPDLLPRTGRPRVLVVDQVAGDCSVVYGGADAATFDAMCHAALAENPGAEVYAKLHPDALRRGRGAKRGYLASRPLPPGIRQLNVDAGPIGLLRQVDRVYTVSSQLGFEAALLGREVVCFGTPFYAGWGFTDDRLPCPRRQRRRIVLEVFAAAYLRYARYVDPITGERCPIFPVLEHLGRARALNEANRGDLIGVGFPRWKRRHVRPFLASTGNRIRFCATPRAALRGELSSTAKVVVWAAREPEGFAEAVARTGATLLRVEDGFLRSCGLGSDLIRAHSLVVDGRGIYYDPTAPSDLEHLLQSATFDDALLARAARVRVRIAHQRLSKYNLIGGAAPWRRPAAAAARRVVLVPGQVADDASVRRGCAGGGIADNLSLLRAVRAVNPDAHVLYKVHPDVVAGNRAGRLSPGELEGLCDEVLTEGDVAGLLPAVDEVHTMTSLAGFEALLHGKAVVTYGGPFYAGWGLTRDRMAFPRRTRRLTLDELVAGALLLYPRYHDWRTGQPCACETVLDRLIEAREAAAAAAVNAAARPGRPPAPGTLARQLWRFGLYLRGFAHG